MKSHLDIDAAFGADAVPGVLELRLEGFEPLEEYTAEVALGEAWPQQYRRQVPDVRLDRGADGGPDAVLWMVRSPWESMTVGEVVAMAWSWIDRHPTPRTDTELDARAREVLSWSLHDVRSWITQPRRAS
ncbi:hypothetical protein [Oryzobacter terrae]|uniref:hypothetical protein n=1 Tax=Oryzobacter terrae TaxID=1620385 RepID=UPI00367012FA